MSSYRFCRTDDIELLVNALNRCWAPHFPEEPLMTAAAFKRSIRDLQVWCSSCMVAFSGADPIGVLIGAKRSSSTLIHRIAVHPDHLRQGHARHLMDSLASKLAILGPPRIVAEVPETLTSACTLFGATGYAQEGILTDYVADTGNAAVGSGLGVGSWKLEVDLPDRFVIPITVDDLAANGLFETTASPICWERSFETLTARKDDVLGLAVASDERIEAYVLHVLRDGASEILTLRTSVDDGGLRQTHLLARVRAGGAATIRYAKVHPSEVSTALLETLNFRAVGVHRLVTSKARAATGS